MHPFRRSALIFVATFLATHADVSADDSTKPAPIPTVAPASSISTNSAPIPAPPDTNAVAHPMPPVDFPALLAKAQAGDAGAELDVSMAYLHGTGVAKDERQAFMWSLESAIQGNGIGEENIAAFYDHGLGVHVNQAKAFSWALKAAEHGRAGAQRAIGVRYANGGLGTTQNNDAAGAWLAKAAIQGEPEAQGRLGFHLALSTKIPLEPRKGFAYLLASAANYPYGRFLVARCYDQGVFVTADIVRAYAWALIAPKQKEEQDFLGRLAPKMSVGQLEQATKISAELDRQVKNFNLQNPDMTATLDQGTSITMTFEKCLDYIIVPFTLQDQEQVNFLIDTGASTSVLDPRVATRLGISGPTYIPMTGIGKDIEIGTMGENVHITGSGLNVSNARMAIVPIFDFDQYLGRPLAGIIGYDILKRFVVHIDYDKHTLTLALPGKFEEDPQAAPIPMDVKENSAFVSATITDDAATRAQGTFMVDTGAGSFASLTKLFQEANPKLTIKTATTMSAIGLGGTEMSAFGQATTSIGDFKLEHSIVDLFQDKQGSWAGLNGGILGEEIWHRFNLTFDFPGQKLFLKKGGHFDHPFDFHFAGLGLKTTGGDYKTFVAYQIVADSPAEKLGLQVGDQIVQIDKRPTNAMTMDEVYDSFQKEGAIEVQYRRDGKDTTLQLPVFDPFKHPEQMALYKKAAPTVPGGDKIEGFVVEYASGAPIYPDDVILRATGLKLGDDFLPFTSNRALKKLYATGLLANVTLTAQNTSMTGIKLHILLQPNPVVKSIAFTGLTPAEETQIRPQLITEEGLRTSEYDLSRDATQVQLVLGKNNAVDRAVAIDVTGEDGTKWHQDIAVPKAGVPQ